MPLDAYVTVTLKKTTVKKLEELGTNQSTSKIVTEAIYEYVNSRKNATPLKMTIPLTGIFELTKSDTLD